MIHWYKSPTHRLPDIFCTTLSSSYLTVFHSSDRTPAHAASPFLIHHAIHFHPCQRHAVVSTCLPTQDVGSSPQIALASPSCSTWMWSFDSRVWTVSLGNSTLPCCQIEVERHGDEKVVREALDQCVLMADDAALLFCCCLGPEGSMSVRVHQSFSHIHTS